MTTTAEQTTHRNMPSNGSHRSGYALQRTIRYAMRNPDDLVVELIYNDAHGRKTRRVVSPIRFLSNDRFLALCLCRCEPRQFHLNRCSAARLRKAADYVMPVPLESAS